MGTVEKEYDLEKRTLIFAKNIRSFVKALPRTLGNREDGRQLIRSSGSIGANYLEANYSLSKKDFRMRIKISRKEARETVYWLELVDTENNKVLENKKESLLDEGIQLLKILTTITSKSL